MKKTMLPFFLTFLCITISIGFIASEIGQQPTQFQTPKDKPIHVHNNGNSQDAGLSLASLTGEGTQANPYQIKTISDLKLLRDDFVNYDKHFILINDLTFSLSDYENSSIGWKPIGDSEHAFSGNFNGNSKTISNLFISRPNSNEIGVFGASSGTITELSLENVNVYGNSFVGGLVGNNTQGNILESSVSGSVKGYLAVGGLVGLNPPSRIVDGNQLGEDIFKVGTILSSSASGSVNGHLGVGGLVGVNIGNIFGSFATSMVQGNISVGGLVGANLIAVTNSSASSTVNGTSLVGGLVGENRGTITISKAIGTVTGIYGVGSLTGINLGNIESSNADVAVTTYGIPEEKGFLGAGTKAGPFQITSITDLQAMRNSFYYYDKHFILLNDLHFTSDDYESNVLGWKPIGSGYYPFLGTFNGNSKSISNLFINRTDEDYVALFASLYGNVTNLRLKSVLVNGNAVATGGLAGFTLGNIVNSEVSGFVNGNLDVGGLAGINEGSIVNSLALADVKGIYGVGGLVGTNLRNITESSASGSVNGTNNVGGLVGTNLGNIISSTASGPVRGDDKVGGLVGLNGGSIVGSTASGSITGNSNVGEQIGLDVSEIVIIGSSNQTSTMIQLGTLWALPVISLSLITTVIIMQRRKRLL